MGQTRREAEWLPQSARRGARLLRAPEPSSGYERRQTQDAPPRSTGGLEDPTAEARDLMGKLPPSSPDLRPDDHEKGHPRPACVPSAHGTRTASPRGVHAVGLKASDTRSSRCPMSRCRTGDARRDRRRLQGRDVPHLDSGRKRGGPAAWALAGCVNASVKTPRSASSSAADSAPQLRKAMNRRHGGGQRAAGTGWRPLSSRTPQDEHQRTSIARSSHRGAVPKRNPWRSGARRTRASGRPSGELLRDARGPRSTEGTHPVQKAVMVAPRRG